MPSSATVIAAVRRAARPSGLVWKRMSMCGRPIVPSTVAISTGPGAEQRVALVAEVEQRPLPVVPAERRAAADRGDRRARAEHDLVLAVRGEFARGQGFRRRRCGARRSARGSPW